MTENPALRALLEVQAHDTRLDQLRYQLENLPAREQRDAAAGALTDTQATLAAETVTRDDLARQQKRVDDEIELLKAKRQGFDTKLYSGSVTNPRELQDLQDEVDSLSRRISKLEDAELEIMEQVEPVEARVVELDSTVEQRRAVLDDAELRLTASDAEVRAAIDSEEAVRVTAANPVPEALFAQYQKLRSGLGGVGVARLTGSQCGGCHLTLSAMEVARMRKLPADELGHCEECGRILVP